MESKDRIAVVPGDGIGVDVTEAAVQVLETVASSLGRTLELVTLDYSAEQYLRDGTTITAEERTQLRRDYAAMLLGALGDPRVPKQAHARELLLGLRFDADLYINFRPCRLLDPALSPLRDPDPSLDLAIFRENTEGLYTNLGGRFKVGTKDEIALQESLNTYKGVERIIRAAFEHAVEHERGRVTLVDKANALPHQGGLWRRVFAEVGEEYGDLKQDAMFVDAMAMDLVRRPHEYEVIVTSNLFGDILSDLAAQVTGGLGLAPSANVHPGEWALFEPVHGSAPDIAGSGTANPIAAIRSAGLLLAHLGEDEGWRRIEQAAAQAISDGVTTPDLGGSLTTREVGAWIADRASG